MSNGRGTGEAIARFFVRAYFRLFHRVKIVGLENVPENAEKLVIVANHASFLDGPLLWAFLPFTFTTVVSNAVARQPLLRPFMKNRYVVKVETLDSHALRHVLRLVTGKTPLLIFPEGRRTTTGGIMKIYEGAGFIASRTEASLLPVYIKNNYHIPTSLKPGRKSIFMPLTVVIGKMHPPLRDTHLAPRRRRKEAARRIYDLLTGTKFEAYAGPAGTLPGELIGLARDNRKKIACKDVSGKETAYGRLLTAAFLLADRFSAFEGRNIGLLLPNVTPTVAVFMGLLLSRKVPAFLNYAAGVASLKHMLDLADIGVILTSREFMERIGMDRGIFEGKMLVFLEDLREKVSFRDKLKAAWKSAFPRRYYRPRAGEARETAVILFTSGSEGAPKGVALSHENIITNIYQCLARIDVNERDYLLNPLPVFHSFGLTVGVLMPLFAAAKVFLYISPLHYRTIPETAYRENCTILIGTNTFLNGYARKAHPYDFRTLRYIYSGGEALLDMVFDRYAKTFGKRVMSGYGVTECSPVVSMTNMLEYEYGTAGRILPGMAYRIDPVEGLDPKGGRVGRLFVKGKNAMKGYLKNDAANRKFLVEDGGWYDTGDIVEMTESGFLRIVGRRKRFAKVSGEMISLTAVEEALAGAFGERREVAVTTVFDEKRGERITLVTDTSAVTLAAAREVLRAKGFSEIARPRELRYVRVIPRLATGKVDYMRLREMLARETPAPATVV